MRERKLNVLKYQNVMGFKPRPAQDLFCYWAVRESGMTCTELANRLEKSPLGIGYAVSRGERVDRENKYQLLD
jgi:predicted N-acetyltransferase YhbS